jgi:hypothetical protein
MDNVVEGKGALIQALCKAILEFGPIVKDSKAKVKTKAGSEYTYDYVSLDAIINATKDGLSNNGLNIIHYIKYKKDGTAWLISELRHISGCEPDRTKAPIDKFTGDSYMSIIQNFGSIITYLKRYGISMLLNIAIDEDDDGQTKEQPKGKEKPKTKLETLTAKYFKFASGNEAERHEWQLKNIGKASTKEWTEADFQKAIDILEKTSETHKPTALESLKMNLDTIKTLKELNNKWIKNSKSYDALETKADILALYASRKKQLTLELLSTQTMFSAFQIDEYISQAGDIATLIAEATAGNVDAIAQLKKDILSYQEAQKKLEAEKAKQEELDLTMEDVITSE